MWLHKTQLSPRIVTKASQSKSAGQRTDRMAPAQGAGYSFSAHLHANKTSDLWVCLGIFGVWCGLMLCWGFSDFWLFWLVGFEGVFLFVFKPKSLNHSTRQVRVPSSVSSFGNPRDHVDICEIQAEPMCNPSGCFWVLLQSSGWWSASQDSVNFAYGYEAASLVHGKQEPDTILTQPRSENSKMRKKAVPSFHANRGPLPCK